MNPLVKYLCEGEHPIEALLRPERSTQRLKECIDRNFVNVRFTDTRGGTELGFRVDRQASDFSNASPDLTEGKVKLVGCLILDYIRVQCVADLDLRTLSGSGHLEPFPDKPA
jgi:hypothetical protein